MHLAAPHKRDFAPNVRLPRIALLAAVIGVTSTLAAVVLLNLIHLFTNLFFFGHWSFAERSPAGNTLGAALPGTDPAPWPLCMAATLGAPLTAVVFAFGLTHDANALLLLLAATLVAHGFSALVMRRTIMTEKIARRGYHIYREYGVDPLERHDVADVMTRDAVAIDAHATIAATRLAQFGAEQRHRAYPVLRDGVLLAMLDRARLDALDAAHGAQATLESALRGVSPDAYAQPNETCRLVATRLAVHGLERLPVLDDPVSRRLLGIVSRSDLVKPALRHFDEEHKRERFHAMRPARRVARAR